MKQINIYEAKTRLSRLVDDAAAGNDIVIARAGRPVARLTKLSHATGKRKLGILNGRFRIPDDINRPLPDDMVLFLARAEGIQTPMLGVKKPGISMPGFSTPENARVHPFVFPAEKSAVRSLAALVRKVAAEADARAHPSQNDFLGELELAISEIATNIVLHAYRDWPYQGRIQERITTHPGSVQVDLIDSGMAFPNIPRSESLPVHLPAVELPLRGYGLMIADGLLEVCSYTRLPGGRNHWHLEKG